MSESKRFRDDRFQALEDDAVAPTAAEERAWAQRIRAGDTTAFEKLYRATWQPLYAVAFRYVQSKEEAEGVVQDVFLRIWRQRAGWRLIGSVRGYLYAAVRNTALDRLERAAVARRWRQREIQEHPSAQHPGAKEIEARLESADRAAAVERALAELPAKRRAVCTLRLIDGLSYAQIAQRLGIAEKTVETQLARGLKFLRDHMRQG